MGNSSLCILGQGFNKGKVMSKKKNKSCIVPPIPIKVTDEQRLDWFNVLREWIINVKSKISASAFNLSRNPFELDKYIKEGLDKCQAGWQNGPNTFNTRVKIIFGFDLDSPADYRKKYGEKSTEDYLKEEDKKIEEIHVSGKEFTQKYASPDNAELFDILKEEIRDDFSLTTNETLHLVKRLNSYLKTYAFNTANDRLVLKNLLLEEINLDRLNRKRINNKRGADKDTGLMIDNCMKNISKMQDDLGITAKNRMEEESEKMNLQSLFQRYTKRVKEFPEDKRKRVVFQMVVIYRKIKSGQISERAVASYFPGHNFLTMEKEIKWGLEEGIIKEEDLERKKLSNYKIPFEDD